MKKHRLFFLLLPTVPALFLCFSAITQSLAHKEVSFLCRAECVPLSLFVREEHLPPDTLLSIPELQDGDILLTDCTHTFGWRHGHAALVVSGPQQQTLEAVTLGSSSCIRSMTPWQQYPKVTVLRLKDTDSALRAEIAAHAGEHLVGIPYRLTSGLFGPKFSEQPAGSQCAYLVWCAYRCFGYDLDGDGGKLVTVNDLLCSPLLETVAVLTVPV